MREMDGVEEDLRRLRRERGRLRTTADALHLTASGPGIVTEVTAREGAFLARGVPALQIEALAPRVARGWVSQDLAAALAPGMAAAVTINGGAGPEPIGGRITAIEAGIDPALSPEFGMLVTVALPGLAAEETRARLSHLMPIGVAAKRGWARRMEAWPAALCDRIEL